jgi:hypothetical protein
VDLVDGGGGGDGGGEEGVALDELADFVVVVAPAVDGELAEFLLAALEGFPVSALEGVGDGFEGVAFGAGGEEAPDFLEPWLLGAAVPAVDNLEHDEEEEDEEHGHDGEHSRPG